MSSVYSTLRFAHVSMQEAADGLTKVANRTKSGSGLSARQHASEIHQRALVLDDNQRIALEGLHMKGEVIEKVFVAHGDGTHESQCDAAAMMASLGLDASEDPESRWSLRWWALSSNREGPEQTKRMLYQCACGYDHTVAGSKTRHTPVPFTGCMGHGEVTFLTATNQILRIRGYFEHNDGCKNAHFTRIPPIPVHPSVYKCALKQLAAGGSLADVHKENRDRFQRRSYESMPQTDDAKQWKYRWLLEKKDTRSLYRQFSRWKGIRTTEKAHINLDEWLDPESPRFNSVLSEAVFHYSARASRGERFEACVATTEMKELAWKYCHQSQIMLDGTFGICERKVLLFVVMGVDEDRRGIPVAFLFFSAPSGNAHTAAGYDTEILTKLLQKWREAVEAFGRRRFIVLVAITDTDLKERGALLKVFVDIFLLICRVHLRRSWRNHRYRSLKGKSPDISELHRRLMNLEGKLIASINFQDARQLVLDETAVMEAELAEMGGMDAGCQGALVHLKYLLEYWLSEELWSSWSEFGRLGAAKIIGCSPDQVFITTNHLEAFNRVLKHNHLRRAQRGGRRLRVDVLLHFLIMDMLPSIFDTRRLEKQERERLKTWVMTLPGGSQAWDSRYGPKEAATARGGLAYTTVDPVRNAAAIDLVGHRQISAPTFDPDSKTFSFQCYSSLATEHDRAPIIYTISIALNGSASCSCRDFSSRGGACKHLRAALIYLEMLRQQGMRIPDIPIPTSLEGARVLASRLATLSFTQTISRRDIPITRVAKLLEEYLDDETFSTQDTRKGCTDDTDGDMDADEDDEDDGSDEQLFGPAEFGEFDLSILRKSSRAALDQQSISRVFSELDPAASKLADLASILDGAESSKLRPPDLSSAIRIQAQVQSLSDALARFIKASGPGQPDAIPPATFPSSQAANIEGVTQSRHRKRPREDILPPSPGKKQKRHESYSIH